MRERVPMVPLLDYLVIIEHKEINKIDGVLISDGIVLKKYISSGNKLILNTELKNLINFNKKRGVAILVTPFF